MTLRIAQFIGQANRLLAELCGWLLSVMIVLLCFDLVSRDAGDPVQGVAELTVFVMICAIYLGLAQCEQMDKHIKVTALLDRLPLRLHWGVRVFNGVIQMGVATILVWAAYNNLIYTYVKKVAISGTVPLSLWPVKLVILLGLTFYWLQSLVNLGRWVGEFRSGEAGQQEAE